MMRRKRKPAPMLQGLPSPSLAKMARMSPQELQAHIDRLVTEADRLKKKIGNLGAQKPPPQQRINDLQLQLKRLGTLEQMARDRMAGRPLPTGDEGPRPRPYGERGGYGDRGGFRSSSGGGGGYRSSSGTGGSAGYRGSTGYRGATNPGNTGPSPGNQRPPGPGPGGPSGPPLGPGQGPPRNPPQR